MKQFMIMLLSESFWIKKSSNLKTHKYHLFGSFFFREKVISQKNLQPFWRLFLLQNYPLCSVTTSKSDNNHGHTRQVPRQKCHQTPQRQCHPIPKQVPRQQCHEVPKKECRQIPKQSSSIYKSSPIIALSLHRFHLCTHFLNKILSILRFQIDFCTMYL